MFRWRLPKIGLDVGARSVKAAELARVKGEVVLKDFAFHDFRQGPETNASHEETVAALVDGRGLKGADVFGCLPDKEISVALLAFPEMPESEIPAAVRNKVEAKTGQDASAYSIDFLVAGRARNAGLSEILVRAYFTGAAAVEDQLAAIESFGLRPLSLEGSLQATIECLRFNGYVNHHDSCVVVDIGETHTSIGLVVGGELAQLNTLRVGSGDINESLMSELGCTHEESERLKLEYTLEGGDGASEKAHRLIEDGYYKIILGIHDTVSYFRAAFKDQLIVNLLLTGGGAGKAGLDSLVQQSLGIPAAVPNALKNIQIFTGPQPERDRLAALACQLHPAIGLALRAV